MSIKSLLQSRRKHQIVHGGIFAFSITHTPEAIKEIQEMGAEFTSEYVYTVARIPGVFGGQICFDLKEEFKK
jgi:hypothetical protein